MPQTSNWSGFFCCFLQQTDSRVILVFSASLSSTRHHLYTQCYILTIFLPITYKLFVYALTYLINVEVGKNMQGGGTNFFITSNSAWSGKKPEKTISKTPCLLDG